MKKDEDPFDTSGIHVYQGRQNPPYWHVPVLWHQTGSHRYLWVRWCVSDCGWWGKQGWSSCITLPCQSPEICGKWRYSSSGQRYILSFVDRVAYWGLMTTCQETARNVGRMIPIGGCNGTSTPFAWSELYKYGEGKDLKTYPQFRTMCLQLPVELEHHIFLLLKNEWKVYRYALVAKHVRAWWARNRCLLVFHLP